MIKEVDLAGVYFAPMLLYFAVAVTLAYILRLGLRRVGFYRFVWHPALFDLGLAVVVLAGVVVSVMSL